MAIEHECDECSELFSKVDGLDLECKFNLFRDLFYSIVEDVKSSMHGPRANERDKFKYNCLGNSEPGLFEEHDWVTQYSSIRPLESYIEDVLDERKGEDEEEEKDGDDE